MELKEALKHMGQNIKKLEAQVYDFDTIVLPRAEEDKKILRKLKEDYIKLDALLQKQESGDLPTAEEFDVAVPKSLR